MLIETSEFLLKNLFTVTIIKYCLTKHTVKYTTTRNVFTYNI